MVVGVGTEEEAAANMAVEEGKFASSVGKRYIYG